MLHPASDLDDYHARFTRLAIKSKRPSLTASQMARKTPSSSVGKGSRGNSRGPFEPPSGDFSPEFRQIKRKYDSLLENLDDHSSRSDPPSFETEETCEGVELQQWQQMWSHVISMINAVIPYSPSLSDTWADRRGSLIDLISKLIRLRTVPKKEKNAPQPVHHVAPSDQIPVPRKEPIESRLKAVQETETAEIQARVSDIHTRMQRQFHTQEVLVESLKRSDRSYRKLAYRLRLRPDEVPFRSYPRHNDESRRRHSPSRSKSRVQELITATNQMRHDYNEMRKLCPEDPGRPIEAVSYLSSSE
jgi:hypothetical protein